ncbi:hypothetical protein [Demequina sp.]|uniref:hypothetical protein n=1 Tax=Demequina sp. TaxID=2050685 RepID=UPI0025DE031B|nr:hypothetical protein [Demequina sp.]
MVRTAEGPSTFVARDVLVMGARIDTSGLRVLELAVGDESDDSPPLDANEHPSEASSAAFSDWERRLGTPAALPNIYVPGAPRLSRLSESDDLFTGPDVDEASRRYLTVAADAKALRIRARVLQWLALRSVVDVASIVRWCSLSCGPAFPLVSSMSEALRTGTRLAATFVDTCSDAIDASKRVALSHGIDPAAHAFMVADSTLDEPLARLGRESQDLVEALGLLEGRPLDDAAAPLSRAYSLVRPGGSLVFSVMLTSRPASADGPAVVWPSGPTRSLEEIAGLLARADIPVMDAMACLTQDGVYAVVEVTRL